MMYGKRTIYKCTVFKSKLEAEWAKYFEALGYSWEYEPAKFKLYPQGSGRSKETYTPDFRVCKNNQYFWCEVKADLCSARQTQQDACVKFSNSGYGILYLCYGEPNKDHIIDYKEFVI
jgi:hypothetical protein